MRDENVCSETTVIRSREDWLEFVSSRRYDGERYERAVFGVRLAGEQFAAVEQDAGLFALRGASS